MASKGLVIVHTGDGKGKTTAALGLALRAWGGGLRVLILQFIKGGQTYGELEAIQQLAKLSGSQRGRIEVRQCGLGFTRRDESREAEHQEAASRAMEMAAKEIESGLWDMVILDEINYAVKFGLVPENEMLALLERRPEPLHLVLTGRDAPESLTERADLVTEMRLVKHPFQQGIQAQKGIEF